MTQLAFAALGDSHLDPLIWRSHHHITGDAFVAFAAFITQAIELNVPVVLVGDVFDSVDPDPVVIGFFRKQIDRCEEAMIDVYFIQGNHDKRLTPWGAAVHHWPIYIGDGEPLEIRGIRVAGFDYNTRNRITESLVSLGDRDPKPQVIFLHQAVRQFIAYTGAWNCDLRDVPPGIPLTILGDIHQEWEYQIREGQMAYYTNASHPRSNSEIGPKSFLLVHDDLSIERRPLPSRPIRIVRVSAPPHVEDLEAWLAEVTAQEHTLKPLVRLTCLTDLRADIERIMSTYEGRALFTKEFITPSEMSVAFEDESVEIEQLIKVEDLLRNLVDPDTEPDAYDFVIALLDEGQSINDVIREYRESLFPK